MRLSKRSDAVEQRNVHDLTAGNAGVARSGARHGGVVARAGFGCVKANAEKLLELKIAFGVDVQLAVLKRDARVARGFVGVAAFDGAEEQKHAHKGQLLGERWKMVTNGLGWAHNSNLSWKENHVRCGIGNIEHYQTAKRNNLRQLLRYLAKTEQMVPMLPKAMTNIFGKMQPPQRDPKKGGAPRVKVAQLVSITTTSQGEKW